MPVIPFHDENPIERWPIVTVAIIALNLISLLYVQQMNLHDERVFKARNGFVPARMRQFQDPKFVRVQLYADQEIARGLRPPPRKNRFVDLPPIRSQIVLSALTSLFIHANWMHFLGNMWFFWIFGNNIEDRLGHFLFLLFYLAGGLFASACHWLMSTGIGEFVPVIGASGAVAVILGAYAVTYPFARVKTLIFVIVFFTVVDLPALVVLGFWFLMQMVNAAHVVNMDLGGGVAWWAHIGGFVAGACLMPLFVAGLRQPVEEWPQKVGEPFDFQPQSRDSS